MVFGVDKEIYRRGVNFDGMPGKEVSRAGIAAAEEPARAFFPKAFEGIVEYPTEAELKAAAEKKKAEEAAKAAEAEAAKTPSGENITEQQAPVASAEEVKPQQTAP